MSTHNMFSLRNERYKYFFDKKEDLPEAMYNICLQDVSHMSKLTSTDNHTVV